MSDKEQRIRVRAYQIWERDGCRDGWAEDHWREAEIEVERELAAQVVEPQEPTKRKANGAGKPSAAKKAPPAKLSEARADASGAGQVQKKPAASRSKEASGGAKASGAAKASGSAKTSSTAAKPATTRSRRTPPT
jgi:hypothetical protein